MKLTYTCSACKKQNYLKAKAETRPDLQMKMANDEVRVNCDHCGKMDKKHINRITAVVDNRIMLAGIGVGVLSTIVLWNFFGAIATVTFCIPIFFWKYYSEKAHRFNSYALKRK